MPPPLPPRKPSANAGAGYSPRRTVRQPARPDKADAAGPGQRLLQWAKRRLSEHFASSMIALAFTLGGLLILFYFYNIRYLPAIDLKSATGILLGVAMTGALTLVSLAVLLGLPGAALQLCLHYRIINPGAEVLDKDEPSSTRRTFKARARGLFLIHIYVAEFLALLVILGPAYLGLSHTAFGWPLVTTTWAISGVFLCCVAALAMCHEKGGPAWWLARVRYRKFNGHSHGLGILGFLTLLLIFISTFLFQLFPLIQQESDVISLLNYWLVISVSCALGIAAIHNWKSALVFGLLPLCLFLFVLGGAASISAGVMRTLKLGALNNVVILTTPSGCQTTAATQGPFLCEKRTQPPNGGCRISGLQILSRIGEEHLLAYKADHQDSRFTLRSSEIISIAYTSEKGESKNVNVDKHASCIRIEPATPSASPESKP